MGRPQNSVPSTRINVMLDAEQAVGLTDCARRRSQRLGTVARMLLSEAIRRDLAGEDAEVHRLRQDVDRLRRENQELARRRAAPPPAMEMAEWEWPLADLLGPPGAPLWDDWLPRLGHLLGRKVLGPSTRDGPSFHGRTANTLTVPLSDRGYVDLLGSLFPPIPDSAAKVHTWRSLEYPSLAWQLWHRENEAADAKQAGSRAARAEAWEPALRSVATALCALRQTGQAETDPYLRLRAEAEITGPWIRELAVITGHDHLDGLPLTAIPIVALAGAPAESPRIPTLRLRATEVLDNSLR